ncbi:uncharacterized protein IAS62_001163 [Cryptococcus decagattii]|uniref:Uncharacterized protein n=1 Tax=Cryptococcus decagattii TaxID=1859122 RepID=A0ABZ2AMV4_9TREE
MGKEKSLLKEDKEKGMGRASHSPKSIISAMEFTKQTAVISQELLSGTYGGYFPPPFSPLRTTDHQSPTTMSAPDLSTTLSRPYTFPEDMAVPSASSPSDASLSLTTAAAIKDAMGGEPLQEKLQGLVQNLDPSIAIKNNKRRLSEYEEATLQVQLPLAKKKRTFFPSIFQHPVDM